MKLDVAVKLMLDTRENLRSPQGINNPTYISEQMQRLTQATAAVEEHLADLEHDFELKEEGTFQQYLKDKSVNMADTLTRKQLGEERGQIKKLTRFVNSSWKIVSVAQSRINHLTVEMNQGKNVT